MAIGLTCREKVRSGRRGRGHGQRSRFLCRWSSYRCILLAIYNSHRRAFLPIEEWPQCPKGRKHNKLRGYGLRNAFNLHLTGKRFCSDNLRTIIPDNMLEGSNQKGKWQTDWVSEVYPAQAPQVVHCVALTQCTRLSQRQCKYPH